MSVVVGAVGISERAAGAGEVGQRKGVVDGLLVAVQAGSARLSTQRQLLSSVPAFLSRVV